MVVFPPAREPTYPDLNGRSVSDAQPVTIGAEAERVDDLVVIQSVQQLVIVQVPQQSHVVLAAGRAQRAIGGDGHRVQVTLVTVVGGLQLAVRQVPHADSAIPAGRHNHRIGQVRRETDARHPIGVTLILDRVLALGQGVPQLDGLVPRSGHDLTVVNGEGDRQNVLQDAWGEIKTIVGLR